MDPTSGYIKVDDLLRQRLLTEAYDGQDQQR
jgi:hypothetical protein